MVLARYLQNRRESLGVFINSISYLLSNLDKSQLHSTSTCSFVSEKGVHVDL